MNEFDPLLPPPVDPPPLRHHDPLDLLRTARSRRRHRAVTVGVGTVAAAVVGMAVAWPAGTAGSLRLDPVSPDSTATSSASGEPTPAAGGNPTEPTSKPGDPSPGPADPSPRTEPSYEPSYEPDDGPPSPAHRREPAYDYTPMTTSVVPDRPAEGCNATYTDDRGSQVLCGRYVGPARAAAGAPVELGWEFCAQTGDVVLRYGDSGHEIDLWLARPDRYVDPTPEDGLWAADLPDTGRHDRVVRRGTCVRYVAGWNGENIEGEPMAPGAYQVHGALPNDISATWTRSAPGGTVATIVLE